MSNQKTHPYVKSYTDRHGRRRHYFRRRGVPQTPLPGQPGSPQFEAAYQAAMNSEPFMRARSRRTWGYVYAIRVIGFDLVKIGYSTDPKQRLAQLEAGAQMAGGLDMILSFPAKPAVERALHEKFGSSRLFGEWFRLSGDVAQWLEENSCLPGRRLSSLSHLNAAA